MEDGGRFDVVSGVFMLARELRREITDLMATEQWAIDAGFRPPCLGVMAVVSKLAPVSQRVISDHLGLDASDVVGVLDILEKAGMVERRRDPDDRRRHAVVLTEAGEQASRRLMVLRSQVEARVLAGLEPEERTQLADLLDRAIACRSTPAPADHQPSPPDRLTRWLAGSGVSERPDGLVHGQLVTDLGALAPRIVTSSPGAATMGGMLERLPERARTPAMARAIMAPSAILLAGAGTAAAILAGVPLAAAAVVGAAAWAGKVAWALPRKERRPDMNPATVKEPWRSLVRQSVKAEDRFHEIVRGTRAGPLKDRLAEVSAQVSVAVDASWQIAQRGNSLDAAVRELDADAIAAELAAREHELGQSPDRPQLEGTVAALRRQLESARRVEDVARDALDRLRRLNAQLNEAVARAVELSLGPADVDALQPLGADIDGVVSELESLRLALEEAGTSS